MHHHVVHAGPARRRLREHALGLDLVVAEVVERERARARIDVGEHVVQRPVAPDRQQRAEYFVTHDERVVRRLDQERRRDLARSSVSETLVGRIDFDDPHAA